MIKCQIYFTIKLFVRLHIFNVENQITIEYQ